MTTRILDLPNLSFSMSVGNNEDWLDSWAYLDASSNPIPLAGITLNLMARRSAADQVVNIIASTAALVGSLPVSGMILVGGAGGNVVGLNIPRAQMQRVPPGIYAFEVQAVADAITRTVATGVLTVLQGVIR